MDFLAKRWTQNTISTFYETFWDVKVEQDTVQRNKWRCRVGADAVLGIINHKIVYTENILHCLSAKISENLFDNISVGTLAAITMERDKVRTAPPMMNNLSSSRCTHWAILLALWASAFRLVFGSAMQYNSNTGVTHPNEVADRETQWWTLTWVFLAWMLACKLLYIDINL